NDKVIAGDRAKARRIRRVRIAGPMPGAGGLVQKTGLLEKTAQFAGLVPAKLLAVADRQFEGSAFQMCQQDLEVLRIDIGVLRRTAEEIIGVFDDELIERRAGCHKYSRACALAASRTASPLPARCDRARIACHDHGIERSDIYAEFKGIGRDHGADL